MTNTERRAILDEHFSDCIMNDGPEFYDDLRTRYDISGIIGFCGCGLPEDAAVWLKELLTSLDSKDWGERTDEMDKILEPLPEAVRYLILYWIDDRGWAEHGTNVVGSWLTEKGKAAIVALDVLIEELEEEDA